MISTGFSAGFKTLDREVPGVDLAWQGTSPAWLNGVLLRTGPAKFEVGAAAYRHWFDGLAMLHRFAFAGDRVRYANRYLQSAAYQQAILHNTIMSDEFATNRAGPWWSGLLPRLTGKATDNGNVNVLAYGDHDMVALTETPYPMRVNPETLETLGPFEWKDEHDCQVTTAHPHYDAARQLIYNLEIAFGRKTSYRFTGMTPGSHRRRIVAEIESSEPAYSHSFGMSERYLILAEFPLVTKPLRLLLSGRPFIETYRWSPSRGVRFTIIDKDTGAIVRRAEGEPCFAFHHVNAYEEGGAVVLDLVAFKDARIIDALYLDELRAGKAIPEGLLTRFSIPLGESPVARKALSSLAMELPRIAYHQVAGRRHRYVWSTGAAHGGFLDRLVKQDIDTAKVTTWSEKNGFPGEPVFVSAPNAEAEDEGVLLSVVLDAEQTRSFLVVLDAATMQEHARAYAPHVIPFGFHGNYFGNAS
ncbi:MAG TPA: carotenoid oxygenase family protein [Methylocella sp.]|nr:carotenoid oxygenase family protein [Methylocella sp.]